MTASYVAPGASYQLTAGADIAAGAVVVSGDLVGVSVRPIADGDIGTIAIEGIFSLPKGAGVINRGTVLYWNAGAGEVSTTDGTGTHKKVGISVGAAASGDDSVLVKLER